MKAFDDAPALASYIVVPGAGVVPGGSVVVGAAVVTGVAVVGAALVLGFAAEVDVDLVPPTGEVSACAGMMTDRITGRAHSFGSTPPSAAATPIALSKGRRSTPSFIQLPRQPSDSPAS